MDVDETVQIGNKMEFYHYHLRGSTFTTHKYTLAKFPESKLAKDSIANILELMDINRDPTHFGAILNLMRYKETLYIEDYRPEELEELLVELNYYGLYELVKLVNDFKRPPLVEPPKSFEMVPFHQEQIIANIRRPLLVIGSDTIDCMSENYSGDDRIVSSRSLMKVFDRRYYDVSVFIEPCEISPFKSKRSYSNYWLGALHFCLYLPGSLKPKLYLDTVVSSTGTLQASVYELLLALDLYLNRKEDCAQARLSKLKSINIPVESDSQE